MLIDSHCHLDSEKLAADLTGVLTRARAAGIGTMLTIGTRMATNARIQEIADAHPDVWCSVGSHPDEARDVPLTSPDELIALARHPRTVGIGETGLDYFYEPETREAQIRNFRQHIAAARETGLPLIVHTRAAEADTIAILREEYAKGAFPGVLHCFSGTQALADCALSLGFFLSASGILTFKKAGAVREVFAAAPLDRLLVETDAPYLAPVPYRGKTNEPAYVVRTAAALAALKGVDEAEIARITTENFFRLFTRASHHA